MAEPTVRPAIPDDEVSEQYPQLLDLLTEVVRGLMFLPLAQMATANERMQTLGPLLEPTAYTRGGGQNLHDQRRIIEAALALQRTVDQVTGLVRP